MQVLVFLCVLLGIYSSVYAVCKTNEKLLKKNFGPPSTYKGKKYYTSNTVYSTDKSAASNCSSICGYLVEVGDADEMNFLKAILSRESVHGLLISGNDVKNEGQWLYQTNGKPMSYTAWYSGEPNNLNDQEDCVMLMRSNDGMFDVPCQLGYWQLKFVCEVE